VPFAPATFFTSPQPKAAQTAGLVSASFGTSTTIREALREHDERDAPFFDDEAAFVRAVETFFVRPNERVFGAESAHEALARFSVEVDGLVSTAAGPVAVVSHGRVISLYIGERAGVNAFGVWRRLALPSFVVFDPELRAIVHLASPI
jgi:broad specificity phosphatase PhoE